MIYGILIILIIIVPIGIAYYYDYKKDPKEFTFSIKSLGKGLLKSLYYVLILIGIGATYKLAIPFNKNHGIEFNKERLKLGIPLITENLEKIPEWSEQYKTVWYDANSKSGHFKKVIEYGILSIKSETDYYENEKHKFIYVWSKYNFNKNATEYFIEKPNDNLVAVTESGGLKIVKPTITKKIDKSEFEKYVAE